MMTLLEAKDRAQKMWGIKKNYHFQRCSDGGWFVDEPVTRKHLTLRVHRFDGNGHVSCHPECIAQEQTL
jgi:hypothetical protein